MTIEEHTGNFQSLLVVTLTFVQLKNILFKTSDILSSIFKTFFLRRDIEENYLIKTCWMGLYWRYDYLTDIEKNSSSVKSLRDET